jgi:hypothetical protein
MSQYESLAAKIERERRKDDEAHYAHVSTAAQRYEASKSPQRREAEARMKANKLARDAAFEASTGKPASAAAPKAAKPATATSAPKASTPKRDAEAEYLRGVAMGRAAERTRIGKVYDMAKVNGGDAQALKLLATTDMDSTAINARLYGRDDSLVNAMKARHGLTADNGATGKAEDWGTVHAEVAKERGTDSSLVDAMRAKHGLGGAA